MDVNIKIKTSQYDESGNKDIINVSVQGTMYEKNNDIYIVYKEEEDRQKVTNTIKVSKEEISIKKFGSTNSIMRFKEGHTDNVRYRTSQGLFIIENKTNKLEVKNSKDIMAIKIDYNIKIMDIFNGRNEITIDVIKK